MDYRNAFEEIAFILRTGIQWKALPKEYGSSNSVHRYFQKWAKEGLFLKLWKKGLAEYDEMEGIAWRRQSIDGCMTKAPTAQESVGHNPTDREKNGSKRHILVDEHGVPLSIVVTGANRHDVTQVEAVLKSRVRKPRGKTKQNLCADAGYQGKESEKTMKMYRYTPHIRPRGEEKKAIKEGYKARRWVVEVAHSWFNRFRKLPGSRKQPHPIWHSFNWRQA